MRGVSVDLVERIRIARFASGIVISFLSLLADSIEINNATISIVLVIFGLCFTGVRKKEE